MTAPAVTREHRRFVFSGRDAARFVCVCGYVTTWAFPAQEYLNDAQMRAHIEAEHLDQIGMGHCAECGSVTDYLRAGAVFLCQRHAPTPEQWGALTGMEPTP